MRSVGLEKHIENYIVEYKDDIYRLAYSYVRNVDDALDIVQDSILKAFSSIDSLREPQFIKTWFYRIVVNTSLDFIRKNKKEILVDESFLTIKDSGCEDTYDDIDLSKALNGLPDEYKTIVVLRYFEDLKIKEIAEILDQNINTIKTKLYSALNMLKIDTNIFEQEV